MPDETEWRVLFRILALPVYQGWSEIEKTVAAKKGIHLPEDKRSSEACAAFTALYECLTAHFQQYTDEQWRNF
jgi:hypothetical protein